MVTVASANGGISGVGVAALFAGGILVWSGVKGTAVSGTFRDLISGKNPSKLQQTNPVSASGIFGGLFSGLGGGLLGGSTKLLSAVPSTAGVSGTNAQNKALAQKMAAAYGWNTGQEWYAINWLAMMESGWSDTIVNPGGTAAGIAQNINGFGPGYQSGNAPQQIAWFFNYIKTRYGDPINAMRFHQANGWY